MRFCFRAVAGLLALAWALPAVIGQPPGAASQPATTGPAAPIPAQLPLAVKVFKLQRGDPEAVLESLRLLLEAPDVAAVPPAPAGAGLSGMGQLPPGGLSGGFAGAPRGGAGFGGAPLGVIGCFLGDGGTGGTPVWRATTEPRTRAVVVRGAERHLKVAADLVSLHDRPAGAPLPKLQAMRAFALKHATAEDLAGVIGALSFEDAKLATPEERLLLVVAPNEVTSAIAELVKELDVPGEPEKNNRKPPR